ncbi:MAG: amidohydrolase [Planctomycetaceae bacterium]|nr:MAG: amidohydrolase [Planctomycetaceae bacterium]
MSDVSGNALTVVVGQLDDQLAHLWMVRTFIKHSDEAQDDEDLRDIARDLYDYILALAPAKLAEDDEAYIKMARKKFSKLRKAAELYDEIQVEVSSHTNFEMANRSLKLVVARIEQILQELGSA